MKLNDQIKRWPDLSDFVSRKNQGKYGKYLMQNRQWSSNSSSGGSISVIPEHHSEITATQRSPVIDCEADTDREEEDTPTLQQCRLH